MSARGLLLQWLRVWPLLKWKRASFCKWFWRSLLSINLFKIIAINFVVLHLGVFVLYRVLQVAFAGEVLQAALTYKALNILSTDLSVSCLYHQVIPFSMLFRTWKLLKKILPHNVFNLLFFGYRAEMPPQSIFSKLHICASKSQSLQCSKRSILLSRSMDTWEVYIYLCLTLSISAEQTGKNLFKFIFKSFCVFTLWRS